MQNQEILERVRQLVTPHIESLGYELIEIKLFRASGKWNLKFLVDRTCGGISLGECANLNQQLGLSLDAGNVFEEAYLLEVSSPGLDRELKVEKDFLRAAGRKVRVFLKEPLNSKFELEGIIEDVQDNQLILNLGGVRERLSINNINKAKQVIE